MAAGLPEYIDPLSWAESGQRLRGKLHASEMPRLKAFLHSPESRGEIDVDLRAGVDEQGVRFVRGRIGAELTVTCQRCLHAMTLAADIEVALGVVNSHSQADDLPEPYEGLVLEGRSIPLKRMVEDELLLALPIVAMHSEPECRPAGRPDGAGGDPPARRPGPFADLAQLKK